VASEKALCPSSTCEEGAILLGIVLADGRVAFSRDRITVDRHFVQASKQGRSPEKRFRFAGKCVQGGCRNWTGDRCQVIDEVMSWRGTPAASPDGLPQCSIRSACRWFEQSGAAACVACPGIVTDLRAEVDG